jgi:hypothetical protein
MLLAAGLTGSRTFEARIRRIKMSKNKTDDKNELDCEVTVFDGAHNTCDQTEGDAGKKQTADRSTASKEKEIKDNYNI